MNLQSKAAKEFLGSFSKILFAFMFISLQGFSIDNPKNSKLNSLDALDSYFQMQPHEKSKFHIVFKDLRIETQELNQKNPSQDDSKKEGKKEISDVQAPNSPAITIPISMVDFGRPLKPAEIAFLNKCDMNERFGKLNRPLCTRIRDVYRNLPIQNLKSGLIYDDGTIDPAMINSAFASICKTPGNTGKALNLVASNPYLCEFGNHSTAVASTLVQAYHRAPLVAAGGDKKSGNYSNGETIDDLFTVALINDLLDPTKRSQVLKNPCVINSSYGYGKFLGSDGDPLDEGKPDKKGIWQVMWDAVDGSVVVQAAGNEKTDLAKPVGTQYYETATNMQYVMNNPLLRGRLIHAMASVPSQVGSTTAYITELASNFSNYYSDQKNSFISFARDHSLMAPGDYVWVPLDCFDDNGNGKILEPYTALFEWAGTSASAPCVTGAILRLCNDFNLKGIDAAKILLETADHLQLKSVNTILKNMNLGAAIEEGLRQKILSEITDKKINQASVDIRYAYFNTLIQTYFQNIATTDLLSLLSIDEKNFLLDIASSLSVLKVSAVSAASASGFKTVKGGAVTSLVKSGFYVKYVQNSLFEVNYLYDAAPIITSVACAKNTDRSVTFTVNFSCLAPFAMSQIDIKGILDSTVALTPATKAQSYKVAVSVPAYYQTNRNLILNIKNFVMACPKNNRITTFAWNKFI